MWPGYSGDDHRRRSSGAPAPQIMQKAGRDARPFCCRVQHGQSGTRNSLSSAQSSEQIGRPGSLCRGVTKGGGKRSSTLIVEAVWVSPVLDKELDHLRTTVAYRVVKRGFALMS